MSFYDGLPGPSTYLGFSILDPDVAHDNEETFFHTTDLSVGDHTIYAVLFPSGTGRCPGVVSAATT